MSETTKRRNGALWVGFFLLLAAAISNMPSLSVLPGQQAIPWISLALSVLPLVFFLVGLVRAYRQPDIYRGKVAGWVFSVLALLLLVFGGFLFHVARKLPASKGAPQVGQKAPDFTLPDSNGQPVSLAQLLSSPIEGSGGGTRPKAVLLVFYRGYW